MTPEDMESKVPETHCPGCGEEMLQTAGYHHVRRALNPDGRWWHFDCLQATAPLTKLQAAFVSCGSLEEMARATKYDYPEPPRREGGGNTIGDYYADCDHRKHYWYGHWCAARKRNAPADEIAWLERRYMEAANTGD